MVEEVGVETVEEASNVKGEEEVLVLTPEDGLGGDGFVVDGERSSSKSRKDKEDGRVENKSSIGSRLIATDECESEEWDMAPLLSQRTAFLVDTYSASVVEIAKAVCFLDIHEVRQQPMKVRPLRHGFYGRDKAEEVALVLNLRS
ncbi:hypothetical protein Tco_1186044 [Tanacetum coccineum]